MRTALLLAVHVGWTVVLLRVWKVFRLLCISIIAWFIIRFFQSGVCEMFQGGSCDHASFAIVLDDISRSLSNTGVAVQRFLCSG